MNMPGGHPEKRTPRRIRGEGRFRVLPAWGLALFLASACGSGTGEGGEEGPCAGRQPQPYTPNCRCTGEPTKLPEPDLPAAGAGPFRFVKTARTFVDVERNRSIPAYVIVPSDDGVSMSRAGAPYPVVVVVHGFSGYRDLVLPYSERLATWGYITVTPQLPDTGFLDVLEISHVESSLDLLFLLDQVCFEAGSDPGSPLYGSVDGGRLAAVGHSLGGKLSVLASLSDGGPGAVVGLDPVDGAGPAGLFEDDPDFPDLVPERVPDLRIPTLYLGGTEGGSSVPGAACAPEEENYHEFWTYSPSPSVEITFQGADHTDFLSTSWLFDLFDFCDVGSADPEIVKALALEYTVAFLNDALLGWARFREDYAGDGIDADEDDGFVTWQRRSIASIVLWELSKLVQLGRVTLDLDDPDMTAALSSIHVWPLDLEIASVSTQMDFTGDPADELIAATSVVHRVPLVTRNRRILRSKIVPFPGSFRPTFRYRNLEQADLRVPQNRNILSDQLIEFTGQAGEKCPDGLRRIVAWHAEKQIEKKEPESAYLLFEVISR